VDRKCLQTSLLKEHAKNAYNIGRRNAKARVRGLTSASSGLSGLAGLEAVISKEGEEVKYHFISFPVKNEAPSHFSNFAVVE
jgi:hypothetical protein